MTTQCDAKKPPKFSLKKLFSKNGAKEKNDTTENFGNKTIVDSFMKVVDKSFNWFNKHKSNKKQKNQSFQSPQIVISINPGSKNSKRRVSESKQIVINTSLLNRHEQSTTTRRLKQQNKTFTASTNTQHVSFSTSEQIQYEDENFKIILKRKTHRESLKISESNLNNDFIVKSSMSRSSKRTSCKKSSVTRQRKTQDETFVEENDDLNNAFCE